MKRIFQIILPLFTIYHLAFTTTNAQAFQIAGGFVQLNNSSLVLEDANFVNNGTFSSTAGNVEMVGTATNTIGGTSESTFSELTINKTSGEVQLTQNAGADGNLQFDSGLLDVQNSNFTMGGSATITGADASKYMETSGSGALVRPVVASDVFFPVGITTYTPATLNNSGTADDFSVRVEGSARSRYDISAFPETTDVVNRSWHITEATTGGSNVDMTLQWNAAEELAGFDRSMSGIAYWNGALWNKVDTYTAAAANGSAWTQSRTGLTDFTTPFAIEDADEELGEAELVQVRVFLQGPLSGTSMGTGLSGNNLIPLTDPYTGIKSVSSIASDIVDWVMVEIRDPLDNTNVIARQAGLLRSDGLVLDKFGSGAMRFNNLGVTSAYIAVRHRNHLGAMSAVPVSF